ncbi:MAG: outer membrane lipoprotein carrier protein LolA [Ignavibacteriaceae bacterium]|nr:outer membrane lipoprotein carrier protein LolA [Ignavibacteriaceae bacterium]
MNKKLFLICISLIFLFTISFAQEDAQTVLKNIQDKFESISDLSAQLTQSVNGNVNLKGKVHYKKENQLRFEFKNILIVSDGETSWSYNQKDNKVFITDYESEGNKILSMRQIIFEYPQDCDLNTYESESQTVLKLIPKDDEFSFNSIQLFISGDNLITKALIDDPATGEIQIELSDYQLNTNLPDSFFQFSPPEGSQVIDLR